MSININTILKGPAIITYDGATFYSKDDIILAAKHKTMPVHVDRWGTIDERVLDTDISVTFTPAGEWEALGVLFSHASRAIGDFITAAVDKPLEIHTSAGTRLTLHNAAITRMPNIRGSAAETLLGKMEFNSFPRNGMERTAPASRWSIAEGEPLVDASFDPMRVLVQSYTLAWGATPPWSSLPTRAGFTLEWKLDLSPITSDREGVITQQLSNLSATVKAQVLGITEAQLIEKMLVQDAGAARGRSLAVTAQNLVITATGVHIVLYGAALKSAPQAFGRNTLRIGELEWIATRTLSSGVAGPLAYVGSVAP